jgi:hypothetical protein
VVTGTSYGGVMIYTMLSWTDGFRCVYDPRKVTYAELLDVFWRNIDPTTPDRRFCDTGSQHRSAIFVHDDAQRRLAEESRAAVGRRLGQPVVTEIAGLQVLPGRVVPPGLLPEEPDPLQVLPVQLRPGRAARDPLGKGEGRLDVTTLTAGESFRSVRKPRAS